MVTEATPVAPPATIRPATRGCGRGWNSRVSTPSGMTRTLPGGTRKSRQMSVAEDCDAVRIGPHRRATRACIRTNEYQRHLPSLLSPFACAISIRLSTLIGWWMLVTSGSPALGSASSPYASTWLSCTRSKSASRPSRTWRARQLNVSGSGNAPVFMAAHS